MINSPYYSFRMKIRTETHCFHEFISAKLINVYAENTSWKCCGRHEIKRGTEGQPRALYDMKMMAHLLSEIYYYNILVILQ